MAQPDDQLNGGDEAPESGGPPSAGQPLLDQGLRRYEEGDLVGALALWEEALELDPDLVRAREYYDYVHENYEALAEQFAAAAEGGVEAPVDAPDPLPPPPSADVLADGLAAVDAGLDRALDSPYDAADPEELGNEILIEEDTTSDTEPPALQPPPVVARPVVAEVPIHEDPDEEDGPYDYGDDGDDEPRSIEMEAMAPDEDMPGPTTGFDGFRGELEVTVPSEGPRPDPFAATAQVPPVMPPAPQVVIQPRYGAGAMRDIDPGAPQVRPNPAGNAVGMPPVSARSPTASPAKRISPTNPPIASRTPTTPPVGAPAKRISPTATPVPPSKRSSPATPPVASQSPPPAKRISPTAAPVAARTPTVPPVGAPAKKSTPPSGPQRGAPSALDLLSPSSPPVGSGSGGSAAAAGKRGGPEQRTPSSPPVAGRSPSGRSSPTVPPVAAGRSPSGGNRTAGPGAAAPSLAGRGGSRDFHEEDSMESRATSRRPAIDDRMLGAGPGSQTPDTQEPTRPADRFKHRTPPPEDDFELEQTADFDDLRKTREHSPFDKRPPVPRPPSGPQTGARDASPAVIVDQELLHELDEIAHEDLGADDEPIDLLSAPPARRSDPDRTSDFPRRDAGKEAREERIRRRVENHLREAQDAAEKGDYVAAVTAVEGAQRDDEEGAVVPVLLHRHRDLLYRIYEGHIGDMTAVPLVAVPLHEIAAHALDHRTGFLLSRIDGMLTFEDILDVAGMPRLEAYQILSNLLRKGVIEVR